MKSAEDPGTNEHGPLIGLGIIYLLAIAGYAFAHPQSKAAPAAAATTPQEFYERERAGLHSLEDTDIETTEQKLDRIRRRDAASRQSP